MSEDHAECESCNQRMEPGTGCTMAHISIDGQQRARIPFGSEELDFAHPPIELPCHDCNVMVGQFHHRNCDLEQCPACAGQLLSCECGAVEDSAA
jgi:hypothetical protein